MTSLSKMDKAVHTARTYTYNNSCDKQYILIYNNYSYTATGGVEQNALYRIPKTAFNPQDNHLQRTYQATRFTYEAAAQKTSNHISVEACTFTKIPAGFGMPPGVRGSK